jgi:hypothetical protein
MWYNPRPTMRRKVSMTILALIALQLLSGMAFASVCPEPCPDDAKGTSCPPVCVLCTSCTHAQTAIVQHAPTSMPFTSTHRFVAQLAASPSSRVATDIFHVPLPG